MGEDPTPFTPEFNHSVHVESRLQHLSGDCGALLLRDILERLGLTDWLVGRLHDRRRPDLITHPLAELLRTTLLLLAQGWRDQDDADTLRDDSMLRLAVSSRRGLSPLRSAGPAQVPEGLASQPTLSRLLDMLSDAKQRTVLREALLVGTARRFKARRRGHRQRYLTLDIDSLPIPVCGHQPQSQYKGEHNRGDSSSRASPGTAQNSALRGVRGKGITSRMFFMPVAYMMARSKPRPKPACGTVP